MNLFQDEMEQEAIGRIQRFARLAETMNFEVCVGFSGGKSVTILKEVFMDFIHTANVLGFKRGRYENWTA